VASGKAEEIITPQERMVGALIYAITVSNYPNTIPLQAGDFHNIQALENEVDSGPITIKYLNGTYKVPGRELVANFKITNNGKEPLRIGEPALLESGRVYQQGGISGLLAGGQGLVVER
jgi:methane/ammonia monooxygenase subunit B